MTNVIRHHHWRWLRRLVSGYPSAEPELQYRIVEKLDGPGGRAYVKGQWLYFDMGPTVITVPHFLEELFDEETLIMQQPDFPKTIVNGEALERPQQPPTPLLCPSNLLSNIF